MKKFFVTLIMIFALVTNVSASFVKDNMQYNVYDETGTLSKESIDYFNKTTYDLKKKTGGEIAVVVVSDMEDYDIDSYATRVFEEIGIGDEKEDNGVLILVAILDNEDRFVRIEPGYGAEGMLPDVYASRIIRRMGEITSEDKPNSMELAINEAYNQIIKLYEMEYDVDIAAREPEEPIDLEEDEGAGVFQVIIVLLLIYVIINLFSGGGGNGGSGGGPGSRRRRRPTIVFGPSWGGGFGGFGGSSGGFGGGGFGGFGGGGSSGGGGASGRI
ncbi:TPM domain-containing protein [Peptoniphilus sp.]|uniref:TPM domain-containing protein n=1 Tax=Peptoniphilus sp. TaxID=1971214 RepID=UPI003D8EF3E7